MTSPVTAPLPRTVGAGDLRSHASIFDVFERAEWRSLGRTDASGLDAGALESVRGLGDPLTMAEVEAIYLPLVRLIELHVDASRGLLAARRRFLGGGYGVHPFIIALAGSVAVGKSTVARLLEQLLSRLPGGPKVQIVTTDGFLRSKKWLEDSDLMRRKGFPESYDLSRMYRFLVDLRACGQANAPVYSHEAYDLVPDEVIQVDRPDILIFEGLNVLQIGAGSVARPAPAVTASDYFDLAIYVDAGEEDIRRWYVERFLLLQQSAFPNRRAHFHHLAGASEAEVRGFAEELWARTNLPNLRENILPSRERADVVLRKGGDHEVNQVWLRRI
ncbi:type I pantothenate kinase [Sphingobium sp. 3R8]|uniref:type I pantothenate kinase n=1 Tax=Sphingobium sp. 3R8 TaxID=2874921 RepID=UPI001CCBCEBF|nr:type I pantothenate kinase [Sphingobium sp. 3R8]MBZ9650260.1 type I pantothenate kinase [Sphingobium sp. 3R8]